MKRILYAIVVFSMIFVLIGCNDSESKEESAKTESSETGSKTEGSETGSKKDNEDTAITTEGDTSSKTEGTTSSSESQNSQSTSTSKPATGCNHNWVAQTTTKWVTDSNDWDETVTVSEAYTEPSYHEWSNGHRTYSAAETEDYAGYLGSIGTSMGYHYVKGAYHPAVTKVVHHDATGHNETVTTGHKCSKCGAKK